MSIRGLAGWRSRELLTGAFLRCVVAASVFALCAGAASRAHASYETGGVTKAILSNGLTVLVRPEPEASVAAIEIFLRVGAADELESSTGIGQLLAGSILAGTKSRSAEKLARLTSEVGGSFHAVWQWNYLEVYAVTAPESCGEALALLADSVLNSALDADVVERSKTTIAAEAQRYEEDPLNHASTVLRRLIHRGTPYDRCYFGDAEKVKNITRQELERFYQYNLSADRLVISIAGKVDADEMVRKAEVYFRNMKRSRPLIDVSVDRVSGSRETTIEKNASSAYVMLGYAAPGVEDADYPAMCIANVLLGGNKSSLLFRSLREERGLGYQVGSVYPALRDASHIAAYTGIDAARATPETLETVQRTMIEQVDVLCEGRFTDDDMERAKRFLIGRHALRHQRTRDRAFHLGWYEVMGLGYQYDFLYSKKVQRVGRPDIERVCKEYLAEPVWVTLSSTRNGERLQAY